MGFKSIERKREYDKLRIKKKEIESLGMSYKKTIDRFDSFR